MEDNKKILFVENSQLSNDNPMSTCYVLKCNMIKNDSRFDYYDISSDQEICIDRYQHVIFGCRSLFLYKRYIGKFKQKLNEINNKLCQIKNKYFIIQDMHHKTYGNIDILCEYLNEHNINIIFTFYDNTQSRSIRYRTPNLKHFYLPHHIDTSIFKYHDNIQKEYDILLFGSIHPRHYPFRKRLFELILNNTDKFKVHFVKKPDTFDPNVCEHGISKLINMSKLCIATKSKYDYLVGKYFEISACKSLIAGDIPTDGINIFSNKIINLDTHMSDQEIIDKLCHAIQNYETHQTNINDLHDLVIQNYSLNQYVDKLWNICN